MKWSKDFDSDKAYSLVFKIRERWKGENFTFLEKLEALGLCALIVMIEEGNCNKEEIEEGFFTMAERMSSQSKVFLESNKIHGQINKIIDTALKR